MITSLPRGFLHSFVKGGGSGGGGGTSVTSVFTRTGDVVAATGDYTDLEITSSPTNVLSTTGDILYASAAHTLARLGIGTSGQVLTVVGGIPAWTTIAAGGGGEIGYDQITSNVTIASTVEATGTTIISCGAHTFDGSPVMVQFFAPQVNSGSPSNTTLKVSLFESAVEVISGIAILYQNVGNAIGSALSGWARFTPTAGSHTYTVTAYSTSLTGSPVIAAGAGTVGTQAPAYCRFSKV